MMASIGMGGFVKSIVKATLPLIFLLSSITLLPGTQGADAFDLMQYFENLKLKNEIRGEYTRFLIDTVTSNTYDARIRPLDGSKPDKVSVQLTVEAVGPLSATDLSLFQDVYITQYWHDPRLFCPNVNHSINGEPVLITANPELFKDMWKPDTYFRNLIKTQQTYTNNNQVGIVVKVSTEGHVQVTHRMQVTSHCDMHFNFFPFDRQLCQLQISSFSYDNDDLVFKWHKKQPITFISQQIPQFFFLDHSLTVTEFKIPSQANPQTVLVLQYLFQRSSTLYVFQIFIPAIFIVFVSWITFWVNRTAVPARASIGITCVLTMITLTMGCIKAFPSNLMYTPVDIYLGSCFMFVFGALIEFAFVNFYDTNSTMHKDQKIPEEKHLLDNGIMELEAKAAPAKFRIGVSVKGLLCSGGSTIDAASRIIYPVIFITFNAVFWVVCLCRAKKFNEVVASGMSEYKFL